MKKIILFISSLIVSISASAQESTQMTFWDDPVHHPMTPLYAIMLFIFIVLLMMVVVFVVVLRAFNVLVEQTERDKARQLGVEYVPKPSWWSKLTKVLNDSVPVEQERDIDLGHNYDGIRELDNHLPPWWKWLFIGTIGWAAVYIVVFHLTSSLPLSEEEYLQEVAAADKAKQSFLASQPEALIDVEQLTFTADAEIIAKGQKVFSNNCIACHRQDGGGNTIGPNLTDKYWLHGGGIKNIFHTVNNGVVEKGMPSWGKALSPSEIRDVAFFVMSLQGSNPENAKLPQGELFENQEPKQEDQPADTVKVRALL